MKVARAAIGLVLLSACSESKPVQPMVIFCESAIREVIGAPSSYMQIQAEEDRNAQKALVEFDAQNAYGATVRSVAACGFDRELGITAMVIDGRSVEVPGHLRSTAWKPGPPPSFD